MIPVCEYSQANAFAEACDAVKARWPEATIVATGANAMIVFMPNGERYVIDVWTVDFITMIKVTAKEYDRKKHCRTGCLEGFKLMIEDYDGDIELREIAFVSFEDEPLGKNEVIDIAEQWFVSVTDVIDHSDQGGWPAYSFKGTKKNIKRMLVELGYDEDEANDLVNMSSSCVRLTAMAANDAIAKAAEILGVSEDSIDFNHHVIYWRGRPFAWLNMMTSRFEIYDMCGTCVGANDLILAAKEAVSKEAK